MSERRRDFDERREIIRSIIADDQTRPLSDFNLSSSEEIFYRSRSTKALNKLTRKTSKFKAYYALKRARPFALVVAVSATAVAAVIFGAAYLWAHTGKTPAYPVFAALLSIAAVAIGWAITGWLSHRNTIRQNTNNMIFARFSQAPFGEAVQRFHRKWGLDEFPLVSEKEINDLCATGADADWMDAAAAGYLLNYLEFIAGGVVKGDLDYRIITGNFRGVICYYHDKCLPLIRTRSKGTRIYENLIKLRTHYRET